jgi:hypothetical protein
MAIRKYGTGEIISTGQLDDDDDSGVEHDTAEDDEEEKTEQE